MSARTVSIDLAPRTRERFDRQLGGWAPSIGAHCSTPKPPDPTCPPTKPDPKAPPTPPTKPDPKAPPDEDDG